MDVSLEYLRPFYPLNEDEIGESPFGRPFVFSSPVTDNRDWEFEIERLLEEVGKNHDIPFEITLVGNHHIASKCPDRGIQEHWEVFRRIMNSAGDLIAVKKKRLPSDMRNTSGEFSVGHTLLVFVEDKLLWYESHWEDWNRKIIQFLESLDEFGPDFLGTRTSSGAEQGKGIPNGMESRIISKADTPLEGELVLKLLRSGLLGEGEVHPQFPVGRRYLFGNGYYLKVERPAFKWIDLLFEREDMIWIIEAKKSLNWQALGQALGYAVLYEDDFNPKKDIMKGIVSQVSDSAVQRCCEKLQVRYFSEKELS